MKLERYNKVELKDEEEKWGRGQRSRSRKS